MGITMKVKIKKLSPDVEIIRTKRGNVKRAYIYLGDYRIAKVEILQE